MCENDANSDSFIPSRLPHSLRLQLYRFRCCRRILIFKLTSNFLPPTSSSPSLCLVSTKNVIKMKMKNFSALARIIKVKEKSEINLNIQSVLSFISNGVKNTITPTTTMTAAISLRRLSFCAAYTQQVFFFVTKQHN
jgi:hypothetical protein